MTPHMRVILILLSLAGLVSISGAYIITIDAPQSVTIGSPLVITGSTSFPEDTYFDLVLYYSKYTAGEVKRQKIIVDQSKQFRADFETRNLEKGQYKVEIHAISSDGKAFVESSLGSASVTRRVIQLVDRSDELSIDSEQSQKISTALIVSGKLKDNLDGVVTLRAFGPDDYTFGPQQLITSAGVGDSDGHFSTRIPVTEPGEYQISFSDKNGFICESSFNVTDDTATKQEVTTPLPTPTITRLPSPPGTDEQPQPPSSAGAESPLPAAIILMSIISGYCLYTRMK